MVLRVETVEGRFDSNINIRGTAGEGRCEEIAIGVAFRARAVNTLGEPMDGAWYTHPLRLLLAPRGARKRVVHTDFPQFPGKRNVDQAVELNLFDLVVRFI